MEICVFGCVLPPLPPVHNCSNTGDTRKLAQQFLEVNIFWWYYKSPKRRSSPVNPWPTILWLQGGPGGSSVGRGNFLEIGPLDINLKPHNWTWLHKDNSVGVGYSYAEDPSAVDKTNSQAAMDVTELLKVLVRELPTLQDSPLFLVGESYGGKLAAMIGVSVTRAIHAGTLKLTIGGVALGDSWISSEGFTVSKKIIPPLTDYQVLHRNYFLQILKTPGAWCKVSDFYES